VTTPEPRYTILFTSDAKNDVGSLDGSIKRRLKGVLANKLAAEPEAYGTPLRGALAGFWKHEFASHRVIYRIYPDQSAIVVCAVGKRQGKHVTDVYKQLEPMVKAGKVAEQIIAAMKNTPRSSGR
jgi:mRNA-degrading endonuclease RelE of RelBE toxin-antitoxin system